MQADVRVRRLAPSWDNALGRKFCLSLGSYLSALPKQAMIHNGRNALYRVHFDLAGPHEVVIKQFPVRSSVRRMIYSVRSTKALRSYDVAVRLLELGVATPEPLAAVETWRGLLHEAVYCCRYWPHWARAREVRHNQGRESEHVSWALGVYVGRLHNLGVLHGDLSAGNILLGGDRTSPFGATFSLIDLNRVRFLAVGPRTGLANLSQLGRFHHASQVLDGYCQERGLSPTWAGPLYEQVLRLSRLRIDLMNASRPARRALGI